MKINHRYIILSLFLFSFIPGHSQINWIRDFSKGYQQALTQNKWMVIDFWAVWCKPCLRMEKQIWQHSKINAIKDDFVFIKLDYNWEAEFIKQYKIEGIPTVLIIDPNGLEIDRKNGLAGDVYDYTSWLKKIPQKGLKNLYRQIIPTIKNKGGSKAYLNLGIAYQQMAMQTSQKEYQKILVQYSNSQFQTIQEKSKDTILLQEVAHYSLLNKAIDQKGKEVLPLLKEISITENTPYITALQNYVTAYCYKLLRKKDLFQAYRQKVSNPDWLALLSYR